MTVRKICKRRSNRRNGRGMTLVELIVVLVVLSILAASGVGTALAYVRRSAFDQNEKNAATVYQTVQSSLQQLEKSGKISEWVENKLIAHGKKYPASTTNKASNEDLEDSFNATKYDQFNTEEHPAKANDSVHMRYVLRYYKTSTANESNDLKNLIKAYYSDEVIFSGSISVEFDVEKGIDAYKRIHYTAKCLSVFFDSRNDSGWGDDAVPLRSYDKRENTLIGYYDGYKGTSVDTVYLPQVQEGIKVKKFEAEYFTESKEVSQGEGLEPLKVDENHTWLTWSATNDQLNLIGAKKDVYYRIALCSGANLSKVEKVLILNEDFLFFDDSVGDAKHARDFSGLKDLNNGDTIHGLTVEKETYPVIYEDTSGTITKTSVTVDARVYYKTSNDDGYNGASAHLISNAEHSEKVKLKISYVEGELDEKGNPKTPYYEYSLDVTDFLTNDMTGAKLKIYPNYFSHDTMEAVNDDEGIIAFKKGKSTFIVTPTPTPTPVPQTTP